jgi:hypothetical protein
MTALRETPVIVPVGVAAYNQLETGQNFAAQATLVPRFSAIVADVAPHQPPTPVVVAGDVGGTLAAAKAARSSTDQRAAQYSCVFELWHLHLCAFIALQQLFDEMTTAKEHVPCTLTAMLATISRKGKFPAPTQAFESWRHSTALIRQVVFF